MLKLRKLIFGLCVVVSVSSSLWNRKCFANDPELQTIPRDVRILIFSLLPTESLKVLEKTSHTCRIDGYAVDRLAYNRARNSENTPVRVVKAADAQDPFVHFGNILRVEDLEFSPVIHTNMTRSEAIQACAALGRGSRLPSDRDFRVLRRAATVGNPPTYNYKLLLSNMAGVLAWSATTEKNGHPTRSSFQPMMGKIFHESDLEGESLEDKLDVVCVRPMEPAKEVLPNALNLTVRTLQGRSYSLTVDEEYTGADLLIDLKNLMGLGKNSMLIYKNSPIYAQDPLVINGLKDGDTVFLKQLSPMAALGTYDGHNPKKTEALYQYNIEKAAKGNQ